MEEKHCLECGSAIMGRVDKKFCSDLCRNSFNNNKNRSTNNLVRKVNGILKRNRDVLAELNVTGKTNISKKRLQESGFNFQYHTNVYTTKQGKNYYFCYDQGFLPLENDYVTLVIKQEYIS